MARADFWEGAAGSHRRGFEEVLGAKNYNMRIREDRAVADRAFDQVDAGHGAGHVGPLGEVGRGGFDLLKP